MPSTIWSRVGTLLATGTLALTAVSCGDGGAGTAGEPGASGPGPGSSSPGSPTASAPAGSAKARLAAEWLAGQPDEGLVRNEEFGTDDYGLSLDTAVALRRIGGHEQTVTAILDAVSENIDNYTTGAAFGTSDVYAGSAAKALAVLTAAGRDPGDVDGVDLLTRVEERVIDSGPAAGRIQDEVDPTNESGADYANVIGQGWAVRGLTSAGSDEAAAATDYLLAQQCEAGFFRLDFTEDKEAEDQSCDAAPPRQQPPVDTTALVVVLLHDLEVAGDLSGEVDDALGAATAWVVQQQAANGSFSGGTQSEGANANSTGLAGWALGVTSETEAATRAAAWVQQRQIGPQGACEIPEAAGAIGYDEASVRKACRAGKLAGPVLDQWRRTTAQAAPALRWAPEER